MCAYVSAGSTLSQGVAAASHCRKTMFIAVFEVQCTWSHALRLFSLHQQEAAPARSRLSLLGIPAASTSAPEALTPSEQATPATANGDANGTPALTKSQKKAARKRAKAAQEAGEPSGGR